MSMTGYNICILSFFALSLPLPIVQLIYGTKYRHDYNCDSFVGVSDWLIIKGSTMLGAIFFGLVMVGFINHYALYNKASSATCAAIMWCLYMVALFFQTFWVVVGSVLFWRDCIDITPSSVNDLMLASLIIGYIDLLFAWLTRKSD